MDFPRGVHSDRFQQIPIRLMKPISCLLTIAACLLPHFAVPAENSLPVVTGVDFQPLAAQVRRLFEAMNYLGTPLPASDRKDLDKILSSAETETSAAEIQRVLDRHCLLGVQINPESRVKVASGNDSPELLEQGWRVFLVKVQNQAGVTAELRVSSPQGKKLAGSSASEVPDRWIELAMFNDQPLKKNLSGLPLEYRLIQIYSRDAGKREARISFDVGQGSQDLGFRNEADLLFQSHPAYEVKFAIRDENGKPTTASFVIRDKQGRIYPSPAKRLAPDFAFHPQIYRANNESVRLPAGVFTLDCSRGPESLTVRQQIEVKGPGQNVSFDVKRWIDPSLMGWWSGDHHIHAAGCAHYTKPTEGVHAPDMMRHCLGEDLKVGCNLTWGPCFDYQKQFFTGKIDDVSKYPYLLRYDIEVSGFGSHQSGHLCLLRLRNQMYPGGDSTHHWPTLCLNTLRWARKQGAVGGPAHSGWGLEVKTDQLPNYEIPPFSGIGANEYIVDVTHEVEGPAGKPVPAVDFLSMVDTPYVWELNIWYHTLNCGFKTRISGETDFPCIYGERVGLGRSYVRLGPKLDFDQWCEGIRKGANYVSDGKSHLIDFKLNSVALGENGSEVPLPKPGKMKATVRAAALLGQTPQSEIRSRRFDQKPYWDIERARIDDSREVPVELLVNGLPVARKTLAADGKLQDMEFDFEITRSSWVALRILPSSHTNPFFVIVNNEPVRASRRSAEWCLRGVDQCWSQKERFIKAAEMADAKTAYDHARAAYRKIIEESRAD